MAIFTVTTRDDETFEGTETYAAPDGAGLSLREAIGLANATEGFDTINFAIEGDDQTLALTNGELEITGGVLIDGEGQTIDAQAASRILSIAPGAVTFADDLNLINGFAGVGGAIINQGTLILSDSTLSGNRAETFMEIGGETVGTGVGGAIFNPGTLSLVDVALTDNSSNHRGGAISNTGSLSINQSTIANNTADTFAGAVDNVSNLGDGAASIFSTTISGNSAGSFGGGILNGYGDTISIYQSTLANNIALRGGALYNFGGGASLTNATVTGNTSSQDYDTAAIHSRFGTLALNNSIVAGNNAVGANSTPDVFLGSNEVLEATSGTNIFSQAAIAGSTGTDLLGIAAVDLFAAIDPTTNGGLLADNGGPTQTVALSLTSPAIDAGDDAALALVGLMTDQRGESRIVDGNGDGIAAIDIGAFEADEVLIGNVIPFTTNAVVWGEAATGDQWALNGGLTPEILGLNSFSLLGLEQNQMVYSGGDGVTDILSGTGASEAFLFDDAGTANPGASASHFANIEIFDAGAGNDIVNLSSGANGATSYATAARLLGGTGTDVLIGGSANDTLDGGADGDLLDGGAGDDALWGQGGDDIFVYTPSGGNDTIVDFVNLDDAILFAGFAGLDLATLQPLVTDDGIDATIDLTSFGGGTLSILNTTTIQLDFTVVGSDFVFV